MVILALVIAKSRLYFLLILAPFCQIRRGIPVLYKVVANHISFTQKCANMLKYSFLINLVGPPPYTQRQQHSHFNFVIWYCVPWGIRKGQRREHRTSTWNLQKEYKTFKCWAHLSNLPELTGWSSQASWREPRRAPWSLAWPSRAWRCRQSAEKWSSSRECHHHHTAKGQKMPRKRNILFDFLKNEKDERAGFPTCGGST